MVQKTYRLENALFLADIGGARLDGIISDVQKVMMKLVTGNADAWAPIISAVCIIDH